MKMERIIDSAVCLPVVDGELRAEPWFELAERYDIVHSVAAPSAQFVAVYNDEGNARMAEIVRRHPDRLTALAVANPWYGPKALDILSRAFDLGLAGLYLHAGLQGFHLTDAIVDPLVELCIRRGRPIYAYTGTPIACEPLQLAELARRFPEATFILGHMSWSDFSNYDDLPAARQAPNILVETSCATGDQVRLAVDVLGPERVLFGSGYPRSRPAYEIEKVRHVEMPPKHWDLYLRENARRIWKIDR